MWRPHGSSPLARSARYRYYKCDTRIRTGTPGFALRAASHDKTPCNSAAGAGGSGFHGEARMGHGGRATGEKLKSGRRSRRAAARLERELDDIKTALDHLCRSRREERLPPGYQPRIASRASRRDDQDILLKWAEFATAGQLPLKRKADTPRRDDLSLLLMGDRSCRALRAESAQRVADALRGTSRRSSSTSAFVAIQHRQARMLTQPFN